jgi:PAS domain S-box-containing protein
VAQETIEGATIDRVAGVPEAQSRSEASPQMGEHDPAGSILPDDLRAIVDGLTAGLSIQDETGRLVYVNDDAARLCGFATPEAMLRASPDELQAQFELLDEHGRAVDFAALPGRRALAGETPEPRIVGFRLRDGVERWSIVRARALVLASGRPIAINTFVDITARIELEHRLRASEQRNRQSREAEQRARRAAEQLAARMERLQAFARTLADAPTVDAVVELVAREARIGLLADEVVVGLVDDAGTSLVVILDERGDRVVRGGARRAVDLMSEDPLASAVRTGQAVSRHVTRATLPAVSSRRRIPRRRIPRRRRRAAAPSP